MVEHKRSQQGANPLLRTSGAGGLVVMNSLLSMLDVCHVGSLYFFIDSGSIAVMKNMQENAGNESAIDD